MTEYIKIKLIEGSFATDSDFSKFDYSTVLTATKVDYTGADVLACDLEAAGAAIDISGGDITEQDTAPLMYFSNGRVNNVFNKEYEVVDG